MRLRGQNVRENAERRCGERKSAQSEIDASVDSKLRKEKVQEGAEGDAESQDRCAGDEKDEVRFHRRAFRSGDASASKKSRPLVSGRLLMV